MLFSFAACSNDDPTIENNEPSTVSNGSGDNKSLEMFKGKLMEPYAKMIASGNYMYETSANDETVSLAVYGEDVLLTLIYTAEDGQQAFVNFVKMDGKYFIASPSEKVKQEVDAQTMEEKANFTENVNKVRLENILSGTYKGTQEFTGDDGVAYTYEEYYVPLLLTTYRFVFTEDGTLSKICTQVTGKDMYMADINFYETSADAFNVVRSFQDAESVNAGGATAAQSPTQTPTQAATQAQ